ncbi:hypothetical protein Q5P01_015411 [Channa striata]|uniref:Uncharacterized protein n=1 Tax=Channa striata TaxID=64152 RepID=A0AA88MII6_CHASR|nr:hypothetical protein Q5P01_015411 [Channa striata]
MPGGEMTNAQLIQQIALLRWITGQDKVDAYKRECIQSIAEFVRQNPQAAQAQINAEVEKRVLVFAAQVKALEKAPLL